MRGKMDCEKTHKKIVIGIISYFQKNGIKKAVIGMSGGLDSALCARLVVDAIGKENVTGLLIPEKGLTKKKNFDDAVELCQLLGISHQVIDIIPFLKQFESLEWYQSPLAKANTKARIRANILYNYANSHKALVIGTSNKSELVLGYFTKYGDSCADILVIGNLYKTEVYSLSEHLNLPDEIVNKAPTAELLHNQTDQKELGGTYEEIDEILRMMLEKKMKKSDILKKAKDRLLVERIYDRIKSSEHKREKIFSIKVK